MAPKRDDQAIAKVEITEFRANLIKEYSSAELFEKARSSPECLLALVLPKDKASSVIRTIGAVAYGNEVTCLIHVKEDVGKSVGFKEQICQQVPSCGRTRTKAS